MYFQLKSWSSIASTDRSHPLIFEECKPPIHIMKSFHIVRQDDTFLKNLLSVCDLSKKRIKIHQDQLKEEIKDGMKSDMSLYKHIEKLFVGKKRMDKMFDKVIDSKEMIMEDEYPIMVKPSVRIICGNDFHFQYVPDVNAYTLNEEEEEQLLKLSETSDILVIGSGYEEDNEYSDDKVLIMRPITLCRGPFLGISKLAPVYIHRRIHEFDRALNREPTDLSKMDYINLYSQRAYNP